MSAYYTTIARFYDADTGDKTDDLLMYNQLAEDYGSPILDVGCGTGRVLLHLAQQGYLVHGVDNNAAMLARLDAKLMAMPQLKKNITYQEADILSVEFSQPFNLILLTYNALMHFHEQETQLALLKRLRQCMADDGLLVIDLPNAGETFITPDSDSLIVDRTFIDPESGHFVMLQSLSTLDRTTQLLRVEWFYDETDADGIIHRTFATHLLRYYFYAEVRLLLRLTGFEIEAVYGDTEAGEFEDGCERMIIYAKPV